MFRITLAVAFGWSLIATALAAPPAEDADLKVLQAAQVGTDGPSLLDYFRKRTISDADRLRVTTMIRQLGDDNYAVRERATAALSGSGIAAISLLRQAMNDPDTEIARRAERCLSMIEKAPSGEVSSAAARRLAQLKPESTASVMLAYLPFADDDNVADEVRDTLVAVALRDGRQPDPAMIAALDDPSGLRRSAAGVALVRAKVDAARKLLSDADPDVRLRTTYAAVLFAKDKSAVPGLINLVADVPATHSWRAEELLTRLAGDNVPAIPFGRDDETRKKARDVWSEWWAKSGDSIDMAKLDVVPQLLGHTLIVQADFRGVGGRVYEVDPGGKMLWKIENLQQPFDALVVGKDRVYIAEQSTNMVTLRDFQGNIQWNKQVIMPCNLQALPNGHLLIAARNQLIELDQDRNEVFQLQRERFDITSGAKDKNGDYLILTNTGSVIRFDRTRKQLKDFSITAGRTFMAAMEILPSGRILVTHQNGFTEFESDGRKVIGPTTVMGQISSIQRLPNGNTLVCGTTDRSVVELDKGGKVVWEYKPADNGIARKAHRR